MFSKSPTAPIGLLDTQSSWFATRWEETESEHPVPSVDLAGRSTG